jgi:uncharacterized protein
VAGKSILLLTFRQKEKGNIMLSLYRRALCPAAWVQLVGGFFCWALAVVLMVRSGLGLGPWDLFHQGFGLLIGRPMGLASIYVSIAIIFGSLKLGVRPGPGSLANMLLIGIFIDMLMPLVPGSPLMGMRLLYFGSGILLIGVGSGIYIGARMGAGPRDALMLALSTRSGWSIRRVRMGIELSVLAAGWSLGGKVGVGTVAYALLIGPSVQFGLRLRGVLPGENRSQ